MKCNYPYLQQQKKNIKATAGRCSPKRTNTATDARGETAEASGGGHRDRDRDAVAGEGEREREEEEEKNIPVDYGSSWLLRRTLDNSKP